VNDFARPVLEDKLWRNCLQVDLWAIRSLHRPAGRTLVPHRWFYALNALLVKVLRLVILTVYIFSLLVAVMFLYTVKRNIQLASLIQVRQFSFTWGEGLAAWILWGEGIRGAWTIFANDLRPVVELVPVTNLFQELVCIHLIYGFPHLRVVLCILLLFCVGVLIKVGHLLTRIFKDTIFDATAIKVRVSKQFRFIFRILLNRRKLRFLFIFFAGDCLVRVTRKILVRLVSFWHFKLSKSFISWQFISVFYLLEGRATSIL